MPGRGRLLYEYRPPRAHPIVYAGMLVFGTVFAMGSVEIAARGADPILILWYAVPLVATTVAFATMARGPVRIYEDGIAPARPWALRWRRPFIPWSDVASVYPSFYDVTGAFVSPFASSDGKVTQMGLAIEGRDGRRETVRFTPTRFVMWQSESEGYKGALAAVRHAFGDRPLVPEAQTFTEAEAEAMVADASRPFLPFFAIVFLFASAAPVLLVLLNFTPLPVWAALIAALVAPVAVSTRSWMQSVRRNDILDRLSKAAEYRRGA